MKPADFLLLWWFIFFAATEAIIFVSDFTILMLWALVPLALLLATARALRREIDRHR